MSEVYHVTLHINSGLNYAFLIYSAHEDGQDLRIQLFSMALFNLWKSGNRTYWDPLDRNEDIDPDVSFHSTD